uniref:Peptidase_M1 domain-containing protein n=1 Tax=Heterorhabditis bacteriophora TaxID=37862 RepID=A0A1I7XE56_HETBA
MRDWSDLWLNEGFASYYVYHLLQEEHPRLTENEYYTRLGHLVRKQSSHDCPALVRPLLTEIEVEQSFHTTHLYTKGCVMVRMIRDLVSDFDFRSGVRRYLRKNAYRSVSRDELWASLPAYADHGAEHERLSEVMEGWLVNEGVPEVTIIRNYDNDMIRVTQRQSKNHRHRVFLHSNQNDESRRRVRRRTQDTQPFDDELFNDLPLEYVQRMKKKKHSTRVKKKQRPPTVRPSPDILIEARREELRKTRRVRDPSDVWSIPFSYMFGSLKSSEGQVVRQFWLKNRSLSFADVELAPSQPLLANPDWAYPYRVNYDMKNWKMIARLLHQSHLEIPTKSRMQLMIDAETFLSQSNLPHLYIYILGYLAHESDLGVALVGMDAIHRLVDAFQGSTINNSLRLYLSPVIAQIDKLMDESQADTELSALWLIEPTRLSKLYQLRCAANIASCDQDAQTKRWLEFPSSYLEDVHKQVTAVCHFLFTNNSEKETHMLESQLKSRGSQWSTAVQLAACTRSDRLVKLAAKQIVATKNAAIFASSLQSDFSLHYNPKFRSALWTQIGKMPLDEKRLLFSVNESDPQPASKILLHSVKSIDELRQVRSLVPDWGPRMSKHFEYIEQQLQWQDKVTRGVLTDFFSNDDTI